MSQSEKSPAELPVAPSACDCHFHVFHAHESAADARYVPAYNATLRDWEIHAQNAGVQRGVVVQPSFLGTDNRQLLEAIQQHPQTLRGVAVVEPTATEQQLRELHDAGVRGIRLNLMGAADDVATLRTLPASWWSALVATDMHLELHADIGRVAVLLPMVPHDLTVVLDHFAKPDRIDPQDNTVRAVRARSQRTGKTYVTLSGAYRQSRANRQNCAGLAELWLEEIGCNQLLWGSDWPCTNFESEANYALLIGALRDWLPQNCDDRAALAGNAQQLYWR